MAASFWDATGMQARRFFWLVAATVDSAVAGEVRRFGSGDGEIPGIPTCAGLTEIEQRMIDASADYSSDSTILNVADPVIRVAVLVSVPGLRRMP